MTIPTSGEKYELKQETLEKNLGINVDYNLTFEGHIYDRIKKANQMMGLIQRSFTYMNKDIFKPLYVTMVRSLIEYGQSL